MRFPVRSLLSIAVAAVAAAALIGAASPSAVLRQARPVSGTGAFKAVDAHGHLVGYNVSGDYFAREIGGIWVSFPLSPAGFMNSEADPEASTAAVVYPTSDCSGPGYLYTDMFHKGAVIGSTLYYPSDPAQTITVLSREVFTPNNTQPVCEAGGSYSLLVGPATTFDLSSLNLSIPFTVTQ